MEKFAPNEIQSNMFMLLIKMFAWCAILTTSYTLMELMGFRSEIVGVNRNIITKFLAIPTVLMTFGGVFIVFIISDNSKDSLTKLQKFSLYYMLSNTLITTILLYINAGLYLGLLHCLLSIFSSIVVLVTIRTKELKLINKPLFFIFSFIFSIAVNGKFFMLEAPELVSTIINNILFSLPTVYFLCTIDTYFRFKTSKVRFYAILFSVLDIMMTAGLIMFKHKYMSEDTINNYIYILRFSIPALAIYIAYNQKDDFIRLINGNSKHEE